eukprot:4353399-Prymnesium_polylepis.2
MDLSALSTRVEQVVAHLSAKKELELVQERTAPQKPEQLTVAPQREAVNNLSAITLRLEAAASAG